MEEWNSTTVRNDSSENENILYSTFLENSRFWTNRVLLPLVVAVGVIGNALTVIVLTRRRMRNSTNTYLTALAISDLMYLVFVFTMSLEHYPGSHTMSFYYYWIYNRFGVWLTDASLNVSTWLTVTFTVERYIAVCHPMKAKVMCTESKARLAIVLVYFLCFVSNITTPLEWEFFIEEKKLESNETIVYVGKISSELGNDPNYNKIFILFYSITFVFLPLLLLGIFNSFLIFAVHKNKRYRCKMTQTDHSTSTQKQENKITITLIAVVILFMVCQIPTAVFLIMKTVIKPPENSNMDKIYRILGNFFNFLVTINAASNFLLYCVLSTKYRRTLIRTVFGKCYGVSTPTVSSLTIPNSSYFVKGISRSKTSFGSRKNTRNLNSSSIKMDNKINN